MHYSCMNNTKWDEIRLAMVNMSSPPRWKTVTLSGYESLPDGEWFYHFKVGGYSDIHHLDVLTSSPEQHAMVGEVLQAIHVPGIETTFGYRIFGYADLATAVSYL
ncbi:DUF6678 family protein [Ewingella americana]|uniref:Uncharacterized protein n=1 Tax=Ewingella americana TaxID=41202 RepID=A0A502FW84_9GAMM|nr:DUF6678 family protein [Ewingella americana]TPG53734.1 hypothetical protein EAH77_23990 [Ewingella americana]